MAEESPAVTLLPAPGPTRLPSAAIAESQRRRLLRAMVETVARCTYAGTSVTQVVAGAGVSRRTFYEHFDGRQSCFLACIDAGADALYAAIAGPVSSDLPARARLDATMARYLGSLAGDPSFARSYLVESYAAGTPCVERRRLQLHRYVDQLASWHRQAVGEGLVSMRPVDWELVAGAISSAVTMAVAAGDGDRLATLRPRLVGFVLAAVGVDAAVGIDAGSGEGSAHATRQGAER